MSYNQYNNTNISIHALLAESDFIFFLPLVLISLFLSTLSLRRATDRIPANIMLHSDFYPRSPCGERLFHTMQVVIVKIFLSTLSLRRATIYIRDTALLSIHFYPRSPCGERRLLCFSIRPRSYFYPRSPCGERPVFPCFTIINVKISIHALLAESDPQAIYPSSTPPKFLSTLSLRRATTLSDCQL